MRVLSEVSSSQTEFGYSYYCEVVSCPRKAHLNRELRDNSLPTKDSLRLGIYLHKILELYHSETIKTYTVDPLTLGKDETWHKAMEIFENYKVHISPTYFGEVLYCELLLPQDENQKSKITDTFEISKLTCRIDMIVRTHSGNIAIIDHKTTSVDIESSRGETSQLEYGLSGQLWLYYLIYNSIYPEQTASEIIINIIGTTKTKQLKQLSIKPPSPGQIFALKRFLQVAYDIDKTNSMFFTGCFGRFNNPCPHLTSGLCDRGLEV